MATSFDPYHRWLSIPPKNQPPDHYRLLGIERFECDPEVIRDAADRQMAHVRTYQLGKYSALSQKILNELAAARVCLLNPEKKAVYDTKLRQQFAAGTMRLAPSYLSEPDILGPDFVSGGSALLPGRTRLYPVRRRSSAASVGLVVAGATASLILGWLLWWLTSTRPPAPPPPTPPDPPVVSPSVDPVPPPPTPPNP